MGGRRIDDHANWTGSAPKGQVFADGAKMKMESSANGAGELNQYWDTTEKIKEQQEMCEGKMKSNQTKPGYRN